MKNWWKFFVVVFPLHYCLAQQPILGGCGEPCRNRDVVMTNDKVLGVWYLHASIPRFYEEDMKCTYVNITELGDNHLYFTKQEYNNVTNENRETYGAIEYTNEGATSFFYTDLMLPFDYQTVALTKDYWVLVTCNDCGFYSSDGAGLYTYVFTRLQYPPCDLNREVIEILKVCDIEKRYIVDQDQNNCPYC
ncbi:hypothetical protein PVAND_004831 [Polypedilum vanderplanki]|uniref:Lipocalin n=1 Tax=Polypedilum vanderplanki TaxID=319348 RepID=A0A9J6C091_POLVA|nr:hypothetical protein PVAND_004831 [Polypedilum vanderplanki]